MRETGLSSVTRSLLDAARADAPAGAGRAKIWAGVAKTAGIGGAGAIAGTAALGGSVAASASKLLAIGALFGSAATVGLALAVLRVGPAPVMSEATKWNTTASAARSDDSPRVMPVDLAAPLPAPLMLRMTTPPFTPAASDLPAVPTHAPVPRASRITGTEEDPLMREASLVAEARGSLVRGDAEGALSRLRAAGRLGARELEPEAMSLQVRALRALGREAEAEEVDIRLRTRYPENALSR